LISQPLDLLAVWRYQLAHSMELPGNQNHVLPRRSMMPFSVSMVCPQVPPTASASRLARADAAYPPQLNRLPVPPSDLWVKGRLPAANERLVAIVGARAATGAGCERTRALAADLGRRSVAVVSGGAFGIDAAAHEGALAANAPTFAVLGCGIDVIYPDRHQSLFARIASAGGLLSEYPPGTPPRRGQFPARNRIIAALAETVVVTEAALRSGALITARLARELGRCLLAMPGSPGTDALVACGQALPVESAADVLAALAGELAPPPAGLPRPDDALLAAIQHGTDTPARLSRCLDLPLPAVLAKLAEAELDGLVRRRGGDSYEVIVRVC
jgi:DNA processing protein